MAFVCKGTEQNDSNLNHNAASDEEETLVNDVAATKEEDAKTGAEPAKTEAEPAKAVTNVTANELTAPENNVAETMDTDWEVVVVYETVTDASLEPNESASDYAALTEKVAL